MNIWDRTFGKLRSLLAHHEMTSHQRRQFDDALTYLYNKDTERYRGEVLAYLSGFERRWPTPWREIEDLEEITKWRALVPFAKFSLRLRRGAREQLRDARMLHILELRCEAQVGNKTARLMAANESLEGLQALWLTSAQMDLECFTELCTSPAFQGVHTLGLMNVPDFHLAWLRPLLRSHEDTGIRDLDLTGGRIGDAGAQAIASWEGARHLRRLVLRRSNIGEAGARAIASSERLAGLETLILFDNPLRREGELALASSPHLRPEIRALYASGEVDYG